MARSRALLNVLNLVNADEEPVEKQFLNDLKASIELSNEMSKRKPSQTYKPSSLHCIRNMYFQLSGAEMESDRATSELVGICESGTDRHIHIQDAVMNMKNNNIDCEYVDVADYVTSRGLKLDIVSQQGNETKLFSKEYNVSFLCDGIVRYNGKYYILEIKTETSNKFWNQNSVMTDHKLQGTAYSLLLGIDEVLFLYENRDNCSKKSFLLKVTDEMRNDLADKIHKCDEYLDRNEVPPKPLDLSKSTCAYCNYAKLCAKE